MNRDFKDEELQAQIMYYLWNQGAWSEIYTNYDKMKRRLSKIVKNNGENVERQVEKLVKKKYVFWRKNGYTISLNPYAKLIIKKFLHSRGFLDLR
jgi:hypothetical protein